MRLSGLLNLIHDNSFLFFIFFLSFFTFTFTNFNLHDTRIITFSHSAQLFASLKASEQQKWICFMISICKNNIQHWSIFSMRSFHMKKLYFFKCLLQLCFIHTTWCYVKCLISGSLVVSTFKAVLLQASLFDHLLLGPLIYIVCGQCWP